MLTVYGISNCDTVRKTLKWLDDQELSYTFVDFRKDGLDKAVASQWVKARGWESVINKRSTTWRNLGEDDKKNIDNHKAMTLICAHPTLIKRPVIVCKNIVFQGFTDDVRNKILLL